MSAPTKESWHLDKKVPLSLIFAMLIQAAMVIWAVADIKKDVEILKSRVTTQQDRDDRQDKSMSDAVQQFVSRLERIDSKLDRLIEKRP
ncbi:hypothetical protein K0U83_14675 [bacterium]|nr:hypothetical protein [bacterium]